MTPRLTGIMRYPIKGIGRETLESVTLTPEAPMPGDRAWALLHENGADTDDWQPRRNFLVVATAPALAPVTATSGAAGITLRHPDRPDLTLDPSQDGPTLIDWVRPLWPEDRPAPKRLVRAPAQGMADNGEAQVSILNLASLRALSQRLDYPLEVDRFRGNLIVDGIPPWGEFDWVGRTITIGAIRLSVTERIERCRATEANTTTGLRDVDPVRGLREGWDHKDFGVVATVMTGGDIHVGDTVVE
ncbi:GTP-binding protein [Jannaschia pagri]|uniref:GTP-binding protein n=1 Tax=Jannaschia pagri TaxID=2829797 RepID=A0ABQ4NHJ9_9RHOB|nr:MULTISPECIES: MOSC domain-containing protein [unclassified Jannaschia]GIT89987.1 GTP-binding protein [Jannaschia sp. AI_61]GIT93907.1 GTP-binding protein [Jannaschia sp. AI_62]